MRLNEIVKAYELWAELNFPMADLNRSLQKLTEEVGELNAAVYRRDPAALEDSIGDIFLSLLGVCRAQGVDLRAVSEEVWAAVSKRDYIKYPTTGRPV